MQDATTDTDPGREEASARRSRLIGPARYTVPGTLVVLYAAYQLAPQPAGADDPAGRIALTFRWLLVAFLPYAATCLLILHRRFAEGSHNPLLGTESESLKIHARAMQNTLEQLVWLAACLLALAVMLQPAQAKIIPVACVFFAIARFAYWHGYLRRGTLGRSPGVQMTFTLNIALLAAAIGFFVRSLFA